jgi:mannosyl-3-phosphoglycerate phosphatase
MKIGAVFTDLDGTLLEPDGTLRADARDAVSSLGLCGVAVCPVTSKTPSELGVIMADLEIYCPSGFENGAGVRHADGTLELSRDAVPVEELREVLASVRGATGILVRSLEELDDRELEVMTRLSGRALARARERQATLPLVVDACHDARLLQALPKGGRFRLVRGNRFLHLQGLHDKADVVPRLLSLLSIDGLTVACGDAPNDLGLLASASVRVIIPGRDGPHPELRQRFPDAIVAPYAHGKGWAAVLTRLIEGGLLRENQLGAHARETRPEGGGRGRER